MDSNYLNEEEFDKEAVQSQLNYLYCKKCEMFYNRDKITVCGCDRKISNFNFVLLKDIITNSKSVASYL